ncbi:alkaline phosphatase [Rossellomorea aquimaris]|nr:alkaline phosphatase [Rossellomorea aquimaris]
MKNLKRLIVLVILMALMAFSFPPSCLFAAPAPTKNVILMIMDGTNSDILTLSRWYRGTDLQLDDILVGGVRTYSAQSAITDSAAAGSAMATGVKTKADYIGMHPEGRPLLNVLEAAKQSGYSTGIVSTSPVQHATPAAFTSHVLNRDEFGDIGEQQVYQGMDVVLGGGAAWLKPKSKGSMKNDDGMLKTKEISREDGENLLEVIGSRGYDLILKRDGLLTSQASKLWGSFADEDLAYEMDRKTLHPDEPSLAEMTSVAIDKLSQKRKGFFLMVEGSKVDWAAHKNDPVGMISEVLSFDDAVGEALAFAREDGNTMVIAVTDHGNSGLTMGNQGTNEDYKQQPVESFVEPLKKARLTVKGAVSELKEDRSNLKEVLSNYGLDRLNKKEYCALKDASKSLGGLEDRMVKLLAKRANLGFTTHGHTGEDVFLYAYGPGKPEGLMENTDIPKTVASYMGFTLQSDRFSSWYVNGKDYYRTKGYEVKIEGRTSNNPVMVAERGDETLRFPENKDFYWKNGEMVSLNSVNVFDGKTFYVHVED